MKKKPLPEGLHRNTLAVHAALAPSQHGENSEALYLTSGFVQRDAEAAAHCFAHPQDGYTHGRTSNPTVTSFEQRLAAMEGTESAIAAATGMSAILMLCMGLLKAGDHVVCSRSVFGSTMSLSRQHLSPSPPWPSGGLRCGPPRGCCLPRRPPTH